LSRPGSSTPELTPGVGEDFVASSIQVSPDGERLVFVSSGRLLTRRLDHSVAEPLADTEGVASFFFAPDSRSVAFVQGKKLKRVPLDGGVRAGVLRAAATFGRIQARYIPADTVRRSPPRRAAC
jgi:Tol biopolymer transport system component